MHSESEADALRLARWRERVSSLDQRLAPIARRPVDISRPGWMNQARAKEPALDEAGVRPEVEALLAEWVEAYAEASAEIRAGLRKLWAEHRAFAWAAGWARVAPGVEGLRRRLILFSMQDQGSDSRDAVLALQAICQEAAAEGLDPVPQIREVAEWSSTVNRYGMGSTRDMLLRHCPPA